MPNQLSFDVEFTRAQIESILDNPGTVYISVYGTYEYDPALGTNYWKMNAYGEGCDTNKVKIAPTRVPACIKPCPSK